MSINFKEDDMSFRMIFCAMFFCVSAFSTPSSAANTQLESGSQVQPLARSSLILDVAHVGGHMVAVGERGHILLRRDQWQQVETPTRANLTKVFFLNERLGWAVGHDATIIHTQDGGQSWHVQMQSQQLEKPFFDVYFFDESKGIALGAYGLFYRTLDGGKHWIEEYHQELLFEEDVEYLEQLKVEDLELYESERASLLPHFNRIIELTNGHLLLVGELGLVAYSDDNAYTFMKTDFPYEGSLFNSIEFADSVYVMGLRGHVFRADSNLSQWQSIPMPIESSINAALVVSEDSLYLIGNAGTVVDVDRVGNADLVLQKQGENLVSLAQDNFGQIWLAGTKGLSQLQLKK